MPAPAAMPVTPAPIARARRTFPAIPGVATTMRVSAITDVQPRSDGMRVKGLIDSGVDYRGGYGGQAYQGAGTGGQAYAIRYPSHNDLSFRCNLDERRDRHQHARRPQHHDLPPLLTAGRPGEIEQPACSRSIIRLLRLVVSCSCVLFA